MTLVTSCRDDALRCALGHAPSSRQCRPFWRCLYTCAHGRVCVRPMAQGAVPVNPGRLGFRGPSCAAAELGPVGQRYAGAEVDPTAVPGPPARLPL